MLSECINICELFLSTEKVEGIMQMTREFTHLQNCRSIDDGDSNNNNNNDKQQ